MKWPFPKHEPATFRERLLDAIERGSKADRVSFVSLGEGFYLHVIPPVYDFFAERERFDREADEARKSLMGDAPLGRYTLVNFRDVREGKYPYSDDYQLWAEDYAVKLTGQVGLIFMVREPEVRQVIAQECERLGLACEPQGEWDMRVSSTEHTIYTGDWVYEAIGRATSLSDLVRAHLSSLK